MMLLKSQIYRSASIQLMLDPDNVDKRVVLRVDICDDENQKTFMAYSEREQLIRALFNFPAKDIEANYNCELIIYPDPQFTEPFSSPDWRCSTFLNGVQRGFIFKFPIQAFSEMQSLDTYIHLVCNSIDDLYKKFDDYRQTHNPAQPELPFGDKPEEQK